MKIAADGYLVFCLDDDSEYVLATRTVFPTKGDASKYAETLCQDRKPIVVAWEAERFSTLRHDWTERTMSLLSVGEQLRRQREESFVIPIQVH
jgi:hypothetical protein